MKILVVAPAWVGDMVMAHCLVSLLAQRPDTSVSMVAPPATAALAERMPGVTGAWTLEVGHGVLGLSERRKLAKVLKGERFDQAIVLPNSFKSALLPFWAEIPQRTGWRGESRYLVLNDRRRLDPDRYPLMIERFMALAFPWQEPGTVAAGKSAARPYPLPRLESDPEQSMQLVERFGLAARGITALCPGAEFGPAKRWPPRHFAALARHEVASGRQVWLLGSPGDVATCVEIQAQAPEGVVNLAGRTSLLEAIDLIALADRVICNDSGLMHVAAALGTEVVALFGSTSPDFTPPLGDRTRVIRNPIDCSPCFQRQCPLGHLKCLEELMPEQVIEVL